MSDKELDRVSELIPSNPDRVSELIPSNLDRVSVSETMPSKLERVSEIISGKLFLSDMTAAMDISVVNYLSITHIVNASNGAAPSKIANIIYHNVNIEDSEESDISRDLIETHDFISSALLGGGRVLVHCMVGVSRSSSITMHHIMLSGTTLKEAVELVRTARPVVNPNRAFAQSLLDAELSARGENTIELGEICRGGVGRMRRERDIKNMMDTLRREEEKCCIL